MIAKYSKQCLLWVVICVLTLELSGAGGVRLERVVRPA